MTAFVHYENVKDLESVYNEMGHVQLHYTHSLTISFQPQGASTAAFKGLNTCYNRLQSSKALFDVSAADEGRLCAALTIPPV